MSADHKPTIAAIGTWPFSQRSVNYIVTECFRSSIGAAESSPPNDRGQTPPADANDAVPHSPFEAGSSRLGELLVSGIEMVEADKDVHTVGIYSYPNADGILQLDAAYINPCKGHFGSVLGITGFYGAIRGAYVLATTGPHTVMAGTGAEVYLSEHGITHHDPRDPPIYDGDALGKEVVASHDTVGIVALCGNEIVVGCSTSGMRNKLPGRIGDSAIFGSGLYAAAGVGGASATGDGDVMVRIPLSFIAVDAMRSGLTPQQAAERAIERLAECPGYDPNKSEAAVVVMNMAGEYGSATTKSWEGVFKPAFASLDTLKASAEAQGSAKTASGGGSCVIC